MIIRKYGIELRRLTEEDLELLRTQRNSDFIRSKMFYQKVITAEEQQAWFQTINNDFNYYFILVYQNEKIGLVHGKIDSYERGVARGGILIWNPDALSSHLPVIASVCATDLTFFIMGMNVTTAEVRMDNQTAINYNLTMGYDITDKLEKEGKVLMELTKENYLTRAKKIRETVKKISKDSSDLSWDDLDFSGNQYPNLYQQLPDYLAEKVLPRLHDEH